MNPKVPKGWKLLGSGVKIIHGDKFNAVGIRHWVNSSGPLNGETPNPEYGRYIRKIKK